LAEHEEQLERVDVPVAASLREPPMPNSDSLRRTSRLPHDGHFTTGRSLMERKKESKSASHPPQWNS